MHIKFCSDHGEFSSLSLNAKGGSSVARVQPWEKDGHPESCCVHWACQIFSWLQSRSSFHGCRSDGLTKTLDGPTLILNFKVFCEANKQSIRFFD